MKDKISVIINTYNEEENIRGCINSVKSFASEIIVCDMHSEDKTVMIAHELGATVIDHDKLEFVEPARAKAIFHAQNEWVFVIDADERLTSDLATEINSIIASGSYDLISIPILYEYFGSYIKYGGFYSNKYYRVFKKQLFLDSYNEQNNIIHKGLSNLKDNCRNSVSINKQYFLIHHAYPNMEKYIYKTVYKYSIIESKQMFEMGKKSTFFSVVFQPLKAFVKSYIFKLGFMEGKNGFILCTLFASYVFNVNANLWFLNKNKKDSQ